MTDSSEAIRDEINELRNAIAGINARREQIGPELQAHHDAIAALIEERTRCLHDSEQAALRVTALGRALAVLTEHSDPGPVEADPAPEEQPSLAPATAPKSPARQRIRSELDEIARSRREAQESDLQPAGEGRTPRGIELRRGKSRANPRLGQSAGVAKQRTHAGSPAFTREMPNLLQSPLWLERAQLVADLIADRGGRASGLDLTEDLAVMLECDEHSAQTVVSRCVAVLARQDAIEYTGDKGLGRDGRATSPIWQLKETP